MTDQERAEQAAAAMWAADNASQALGMVLESIAPGRAVFTMKVAQNMLNGHGFCHGGYIFTLADTAFAFACNSYNLSNVAQHNSISYLNPVQPDETLRAEAFEVSRAGRSGIYDVCVTGKDGRQVAQFRGHSRQVRGTLFEETTSTMPTTESTP